MTLLGLQWANLFVILLDIILCLVVVWIYRPLAVWSIPIFILLLSGLAFRSAFLIDLLRDGSVNASFYNAWSSVLHLQDKTTIGVYSAALIWRNKARVKEYIKGRFSHAKDIG